MTSKEMTVWIVGLLLTALVIVAPVACTMRRQEVVAAAIKAGADPIAAKCAIEADVSQSPMCVLAAGRKP